jgi:hypothetical protein
MLKRHGFVPIAMNHYSQLRTLNGTDDLRIGPGVRLLYTKSGGFMEENSKFRIQATDMDTQKKIIELKPEMELPSERSKIIDLTNYIDEPEPRVETQGVHLDQELPVEEEPVPNIEAEVNAAFGSYPEDSQPVEELPMEDQPAVAIETLEDAESQAGEPEQAPLDLEGLESEPAGSDAIELTDIVEQDELLAEPPEYAVPPDTQDDPIIELTDIVKPDELNAGAADAKEVDDPVIELTDKVDPDEIALELEAAKRAALQGDSDNQIIQLTDVLKAARHPAGFDKQRQDGEGEDSAADLGMQIQEELADTFGPVPAQQIEATIEKIIMTRYADTIERLIAQAVETAVSTEIQSLKRIFTEDNDPSE